MRKMKFKIVGMLSIALLSCALFAFGALRISDNKAKAFTDGMELHVENDGLIQTQQELTDALHEADDGAEILVGDINFTYSSLPMGLTISKSVVIKSGKSEKAIFSFGAFAVYGSAHPQDAVKVRFENIVFDGGTDVENTDFSDPANQPPISKRMSAVIFNRCVEAEFIGCEIYNYYALSCGGALQCIYSGESNSSYRLQLTLSDCKLNRNVGALGGGAIYLSGAGNVYLNMKNCQLNENVSACGGAIRAHESNIVMENCQISSNRYLVSQSDDKGGGLYLQDGSAQLKNCSFTDNDSKNGGGLALDHNETLMDGCVISENTATQSGGGIWSENNANNLVSIINSTIAKNQASVNGALYVSQQDAVLGGGGYGRVSLYLCSVLDNLPAMANVPDDFFTVWGCALYGENQGEQLPSEENGYCFYTQEKSNGEANAHWHPEMTISASDLKRVHVRFANAYGSFYVGDNNAKEGVFNFFSDGVCVKTERVNAGELSLPPEIEKAGYTLSGWALSDDSMYSLTSPLMVGAATQSVDLRAVFTPNIYTVTYDFGDSREEFEQTYGTQLTPPTPQDRNGYTFKGWFTKEKGKGDRVKDGTVYQTAGDATYYAYYKKDFPTFYLIISIVGGVLIIGMAILAGAAIYRRKHPHVIPVAVGDTITSEQKKLPDTSMLSPREKEVLTLLLEGKQRNEIAATLYISENTVKKNISGIYTKLGVSSRNELFLLFK